MSVRRKATNPAPSNHVNDCRDLSAVAANYGNGPVMRTVALELKPEVEDALCKLSTACSLTDNNDKYRDIGKLRAAASTNERVRDEQQASHAQQMSSAMRLATGVSQERAAKPSVSFSFNEVTANSQAGRFMKGMGADVDSYRVMVESAGNDDNPTLHFYPTQEDSVNPLLSGSKYTDLQHDSFVALVKTYGMSSFEKLADHIDGVGV